MSEFIQKNDNRASIRLKLLTGASALTLTAYVSSVAVAKADDAGRPQIWIELGGQLSVLQNSQGDFSPPLMDGRPSLFEPSQKFEMPSRSSIDEYGELSFQPDDSDWVFSASVRYGRSKSDKHNLQQTNPLPINFSLFPGYVQTSNPLAQKFAETEARNGEQHTILDFQAGKDIGLGLFGSRDSSSLISVGVRFAQFQSSSNFALKSDPDWHFSPKYFSVPPSHPTVEIMRQAFHSNLASMTAQRSFHGIGPSVSWKSSIGLMGNLQGGEISADWGIAGALLFGRQRAHTHHQATGNYHYVKLGANSGSITYQPLPVDKTRSRTVTVPNIGGSVGLSWQLQNFKISAGYRADLFFHAMDGGIDTRKEENVGFYGPFATISIGLGG